MSGKQLIVVPIEPLVERYTEQWHRRFPIEFRAAGFDVHVIDGQELLVDDIKVGTFLDVNSTTHYKWTQLQQIAKMFEQRAVKPDAVFFFGDIEFWGLEGVRLLAQMNGLPNVKITGFLHAASYTKEDAFEIAAAYQQFTEVGWIAALDAVFVGSEYHKQAVIDRRLKPLGAESLSDRLKVTKNPIFLDEYTKSAQPLVKLKKVLLTNRFDYEKRPDQTLALFDAVKQKHPDWEFVVTTSRKTFRSNREWLVEQAQLAAEDGTITIKAGLTKAQYHQELSEAAIVVSHSIEENYGYCVAEALLYGAIPVLKDCASHPEFVGPDLLFNSFKEAKAIMDILIDAFDRGEPPSVPTLDCSGMDNIIKELKTL